MTFTVFMYAVGGYAVLVLAAMLVVERVRAPVAQAARRGGVHAQLRAWPRTARRCAVADEHALPLRTARLGLPARRQRPTPGSCRR